MTILAGNLWRSDFFSDPVRVLSIGRNPIQVLLIRSDPVRVLSIRSDPIRSGPGFVNTPENILGKKQFAKFRMLQIEGGKYVYHIYTFVTLTFRTKVILLCRLGIQ